MMWESRPEPWEKQEDPRKSEKKQPQILLRNPTAYSLLLNYSFTVFHILLHKVSSDSFLDSQLLIQMWMLILLLISATVNVSLKLNLGSNLSPSYYLLSPLSPTQIKIPVSLTVISILMLLPHTGLFSSWWCSAMCGVFESVHSIELHISTGVPPNMIKYVIAYVLLLSFMSISVPINGL